MKKMSVWMIAAILLLGVPHVLYAQPTGITLPKVCIDNLKGTLSKEEPVEATFTIKYFDQTTGQSAEGYLYQW